MPEVDGLAVVRLVRRDRLPLVAFVTAYDEYAVQAFELSAIDYLLKPVEPARLRETVARAAARLAGVDTRAVEVDRLRAAVVAYDRGAPPAEYLRRIPVRRRDDTIILPTEQIVAIVADGELLHLTTGTGERHTITYRLKDLELKLDPGRFVRLSRSAIVNIDAVARVSPNARRDVRGDVDEQTSGGRKPGPGADAAGRVTATVATSDTQGPASGERMRLAMAGHATRVKCATFQVYTASTPARSAALSIKASNTCRCGFPHARSVRAPSDSPRRPAPQR